MAGKYCELAAGTGYLSGFATFSVGDAAHARAAEREADEVVDDHLDGFAVDLWTAETTPRSIRTAADKIASARFLRLQGAKLNTVATADQEGVESLPQRLEREGREVLAAIRDRGWYRADDGTRNLRDDPDRNPTACEIVR